VEGNVLQLYLFALGIIFALFLPLVCTPTVFILLGTCAVGLFVSTEINIKNFLSLLLVLWHIVLISSMISIICHYRNMSEEFRCNSVLVSALLSIGS
jgi:hypothetical protein